MNFTRFLLPGCVLAAFAAPAAAQDGSPAGSRYADVVPAVGPVAQPVRRVNFEQPAAQPPPGVPGAPDPVGTLTGQPAAPPFGAGGPPALPPGSYPSPYYVDGPGCCGPMGMNGRIGYEAYTYSGVNLPFGNGLPDYMNAGWTIGGGLRSLFFNAAHDAAWTVDFGVSYTHNWAAAGDDPVNLFLRQPDQVNQATGVVNKQPDRFTLTSIREVHRTSFNYNFGRDVWLWGSGSTGSNQGTNVRVGAWVGGRYGTSHVDQIPLDEPNGYSRRQNVYQGVVVGTHVTCDIPMGGWILFGGVRTEYGYDWTNLTPPLQGNIQNLNIQLTTGVRY